MRKACGAMACIGFLLIGAWQAAAATYKFGSFNLMGWTEYRVADVKGFWKNQGVNVELTDWTSASEHRRAYEQNRFEIAPAPMTSVANLRDTGLPDTVFMGTLSVANHHKYLLIKKDLVNKSLKGQTIGVFALDAGNKFLIDSYLKTVNTKLADVRLVEISQSDAEANFISGRLQVVLMLDFGTNFYEKANGVIAFSTRDFKDYYEAHGFVIRKSVLEKIPPDDLKKIMRGCVQAMVWIQDPANWDEYKAILKQYFLADRPNLTDDQIRELLKEGQFFDPATLLAHNQQNLRDYFSKFREFLATEGNIVKPEVLNAFTYEDAIQNQALIEVLQEFAK